MNIPIIVISLETSSARRASIVAQMQAQGLEYEFLDGTTIATVRNDPALCQPVNDHVVRLPSGELIGGGELACAYSHHRVFKRLLALNAPGAMILEDDAILKPGFAAFIEDLSKIAESLKARKVGIHCAEGYGVVPEHCVVGTRTAMSLDSGVQLSRVRRLPGQLYVTAGYYVTHASAKSLLARHPDRPDLWKLFLKERLLDEIWLARPAPVIHPDPSAIPSNVEHDRLALRELQSSMRKPPRFRIRGKNTVKRIVGSVIAYSIDPFLRRLG